MIKAIIVDDEPINIANLQALLNLHCREVEVLASATGVEEARLKIADMNPDLVFLDIEMPGKSGFDLLRAFDKATFEVIFVTAFDTYGIMAVKFSALDYLLKPIHVKELQTAVLKAEQSLRLKQQNARLQNMLHLLDARQADPHEKIVLPTQKETYFVQVQDIIRCESSNNYTTFFLVDGSSLLISRPLYEYEALLGPFGFIRCHQSHLVNKMHVVRLLNEDSGYLVLNHANEKIPVSKRRRNLVKSIFKR